MQLIRIIDMDKKKQKTIRTMLSQNKLKKYESNGYRAIDIEEYQAYKQTTKVGRPIKK